MLMPIIMADTGGWPPSTFEPSKGLPALGEVHSLETPGVIDLELIEVQSGSYLGEDGWPRRDDGPWPWVTPCLMPFGWNNGIGLGGYPATRVFTLVVSDFLGSMV